MKELDKFTTAYLKIINEANETTENAISFGNLKINFDKNKLKNKISNLSFLIGSIYSDNLKIQMDCYILANPNEKIYDYESKKMITCETYEDLLKKQPSRVEWPWHINNQYNYVALSWKGMNDTSDQPMLIHNVEAGKYTYPTSSHNRYSNLEDAINYFTSVFKENAKEIYIKSKELWEKSKNK